jgi:hypothetical protein
LCATVEKKPIAGQKTKRPLFKLKLRLSLEESEFNAPWDGDFIKATLNYLKETEGKIAKVWACGPPDMNFEFADLDRREPIQGLAEGYEIL